MNHLHIKASDLEATRKFYEMYFGFQKAFDCHEDAAFLIDDGGFLLAIFQYKPGEPKVSFPEWYHHGFCLTDESDVRDLYTKMRRDGVEFARQLKEFDDGTVNFYCVDPAGYKVEVSFNRQEAHLFRERMHPPLASARR